MHSVMAGMKVISIRVMMIFSGRMVPAGDTVAGAYMYIIKIR